MRTKCLESMVFKHCRCNDRRWIDIIEDVAVRKIDSMKLESDIDVHVLMVWNLEVLTYLASYYNGCGTLMY